MSEEELPSAPASKDTTPTTPGSRNFEKPVDAVPLPPPEAPADPSGAAQLSQSAAAATPAETNNESESSSIRFSLMTEAMAPPSIGSTQQAELQSEDAAVTYDPDIPHTEEKTVFVRHCTSCITDIHICYQCFGELREGTPVLLLVCGLNMQLYAWDEAFCEGFVRAGFYVIRYDNRDIGLSTKIEQRGKVIGVHLLFPPSIASMLGERLPYTLEDMAQDGLKLLEVLHIPYAHVMGISMGGMIAQLMAIRAPHRIVSLTSIMSSTNASDLPDAQMKVKAWLLRKPPPNCSLDTLLEFRINSLRRVLPRALSVDSRYLKKRYRISLRRSRYADGLIRQAAAIIRCPGRDEALQRLTLPALVVHGTQDLIVPPVHGFRTARMLPHSRLLVLKHMGHYFHPSFYQTILMAFTAMASTTPYPGVSVPPTVLFPAFLQDEMEDEKIILPSPVSRSDEAAPLPVSPMLPASPLVSRTSILRHSALQPVVVSLHSSCGRAVRRSVEVSVPLEHPANTPEAAMLDLHEVGPSTCTSNSEETMRPAPLCPCEGEVKLFNAADTSCWNSAVSPATAEPPEEVHSYSPRGSPTNLTEGFKKTVTNVFSLMKDYIPWTSSTAELNQSPTDSQLTPHTET